MLLLTENQELVASKLFEVSDEVRQLARFLECNTMVSIFLTPRPPYDLYKTLALVASLVR